MPSICSTSAALKVDPNLHFQEVKEISLSIGEAAIRTTRTTETAIEAIEILVSREETNTETIIAISLAIGKIIIEAGGIMTVIEAISRRFRATTDGRRIIATGKTIGLFRLREMIAWRRSFSAPGILELILINTRIFR